MQKRLKSLQEKNYLRWNKFTWVGIVCIIFCGINVTYGLEKYMDVLFWDESLYLHRGYTMFPPLSKVWGPTYSLWYKFLSFFISDKVVLYYFNFKLTTILVCILLFLFLLSCGIQRVLSFIFAVLFLSSFINMPVWPRVSHFCIIVILTGLLIAKYQKTYLSKFIILSFAFLICGFARPELYLGFLVCYTISIIIFLVNIKHINKIAFLEMTLLTVFVLLIYKFLGTPLSGGDSSRGFGVLIQHFAMNLSQWHNDNSPFWIDFKETIYKYCVIPDHATWPKILEKNPALLQKHFLSNLINYLTQTSKIIISFFAPVFTKQFHWLCLMICIMLFVVYFSYSKKSIKKRLRFYSLIKNNSYTIFIAFLFAIVPIFVCIYAYPRAHYLVLQVPFLLLFIAFIISSVSVEIDKPIQKITVITAILFFVLPSAEDFSYFSLFRKEDCLCNKNTITYIKKHFSEKDTVTTLDLEGGLSNLLPNNFINYNYIYLKDKEQLTISKFIDSNKFDIIYLTPTLVHLHSVQNDTMFFDLINNPKKYGYTSQKTGNFTPSLLIRITK